MEPGTGGDGLGKRARTRRTLLANAIALFRERGVRETRLAEIARAAEVAPATLYNHFPTRGSLLEAWLRGEVEALTSEAARRILREGRGLRAALRGVCVDLGESSAAEGPLRLEAWSEVPRRRLGPAPALVDVFASEQRDLRLRADRRASDLADLLCDAIEGGLLEGLSDFVSGEAGSGDRGAAHIAAAIQSRVDLVLDGARKRNERVRLSSEQRPGT